MPGSLEHPIAELNAEDLIEEVSEDRASILAAATTAHNIAMLTGTHGVVSPPLARPRARLPAAEEIQPGALPHPDDAEIGRLRAFVSARTGDPVSAMRARLELARAELDRDHVDAARKEAAQASEAVGHAPAAHAMLRSLFADARRDSIDEQLSHVSSLVEHAASERTRADWLCERARLLEAKSAVTPESVALWNEALSLASEHSGAIYGAEVALEATGRYAELVRVLDRIAELARHPETSAWLHVERAFLFDRRLSDSDLARGALERALDLSPGQGPVRDACTDWAVRHRDDAMLGELLETEASLESNKDRAARLDLDAALAFGRTGARARVTKALERAHGRAPTTRIVDLRVVAELARLYDEEGRYEDALRVRKTGVDWLEDPREEIVALRAIATSAERAGQIDAAVLSLERARVIDADDATLLAELDRLLRSTSRFDALAVLWMREAARVEDGGKKADALLSSADAAAAAGRGAEAAKQREAAWLTAPTAPGVYDALAERLAPVAPTPAVEQRIALYEHAARVASEPEQKIYLLEKLAWLKDDVGGDTEGAKRVYEEVLTLAPTRLSAIVGLASVATRARDLRALARALAAQADVTVDVAARAELRLRSAEALATLDPERALAIAEELVNEPSVRARASEVMTRLHGAAERWDQTVKWLARRAEEAPAEQKIALVLSEVEILRHRLRAPARALESLARLPPPLDGDPAVRAVALECLEALGDEARLRAELAQLADRAATPTAAASLLLRAAELDEQSGRDEDAVRAYELARSRVPDDELVTERLRRLGARTTLRGASQELLGPLRHAMRTIDTNDAPSAEPLLATGAHDVATLRLAERLARKAGSAPQLANALALAADAYKTGIMAARAYEGLASLFDWTLPPSEDYEPWERLVALGSADVATADTLVSRARKRVFANDSPAIRASIVALERRLEQAADETERLVHYLDLVRLRRRAGDVAEAGEDAKRALVADPTSLTAASMLAEIAAERGDDVSAVTACRALATIVSDRKGRSEILRDAADLSSARGDQAAAVELLEDALRADPEAVQVAARLAELQRTRGAFADLARVLREALGEARGADAIVPIASELADVARNHLKDPLLAISALEGIRAVAPTHVPSLFLLAELFIGQRAWDKALEALAQTVGASNERADKLVALVGRASIYRRVLDQPKLAEAELRTALEIDPHDSRAIRGLLDLGASVAKDERASLLGRLVIGETAPAERMRALIELADARRAVGDLQGAEGALVEAAALSPDLRMLERVRGAIGSDTETLARVLSRAVARAHEGGRPIDPTWLVGLGQIELDLGRLDEAIERFEEALRTDDGRDDARVLLARALAARGRHAPAVAALTQVIDGAGSRPRASVDANLVRLLELSLSGAGRVTEERVARELRAVSGDLAPGEQAELDARVNNVGHAEGLSAFSLRKAVMPSGIGRHPIWEVASLASAFAGKLAPVRLQDQGASTRDRVKPRTPHPVRPLFDRLMRAFELTDVELAVSDHVVQPIVACEDVPWLVVPSALGSYNDAHAIAALARPMTRIALGVPWFGHLDGNETLALLVAFARQVAPGFSARPTERIEPLVEDYEAKARRAIDRKRRRMLEELEPSLDRVPPIEEPAFSQAIAYTEIRAAFLLSGSVRATLDSLAASDAALADALRIPGPSSLSAVFAQPASRDLLSFALNEQTTTLRRTLGAA